MPTEYIRERDEKMKVSLNWGGGYCVSTKGNFF